MELINKTSINILGVKIGTQSQEEMLAFIDESIYSKKKVIVQYINIHAINLAQEYPWFKTFLNNTSLSYCDGAGVKIAARILGYASPERYTIPDWFPHLTSNCAKNDFSVYLLGAKPGVADIAADRLKKRYPGLKIIGTHHGYFNKEQSNPENQAIINTINASNPDILAVGLGMPLQEKWIEENWKDISCQVIIPMGAAIDYLAGTTRRAPQWMTDNGLEWLGRLAVEPARLWRRYLLGIPSFYYKVVQQRFGVYPG